MKKLLFFAAIILSMGISSAFTRNTGTHLSGYIDDSMCAGMGKPMHGGDRETCAKKCMKMGAKAVFVSGDKVYKISNQKAVVKYAGKNVVIDGQLDGDTIEVTKVTEVKG
jgi:hypothetical protein